MKGNREEQISKFISLILRHKPSVIGIALDNNGWANVRELLQGVQARYADFDKNFLDRIVKGDDKNRYSYSDDGSKIRANQGHSVPVDIELEEKIPQGVLYHGTSLNNLSSIMVKGISRKARNHVHLSDNIATAMAVGKRHGVPLVFEVDTVAMTRDGYKFWLSQNGVWLCNHVPSHYIKVSDAV